MRITQSMISKNLIEGLKNNREQLNESQRRISTGKKHAKISDDPESFSKAKRLSKQINQNNNLGEIIKILIRLFILQL